KQPHHQSGNEISAGSPEGRSADYIERMSRLHAQSSWDVVVKSETKQTCDKETPQANTHVGIANGRLRDLQVEADPEKDAGVGGECAFVPRHPTAQRYRNRSANVLWDTLHRTPRIRLLLDLN